MKRLFVCLLLLTCSTFAQAASNKLDLHMQVDLSDTKSLQRGAKIFVNYCLSCHSASYMRFNRMGKDLNISDKVLKSNFMFASDKVGDTMTIAMHPNDALEYFGVVPPDLSVTARARGSDWLYAYFKTFYEDKSRPLGVNNLQFKDVGMPHVLWELQGIQRPIYRINTSGDEHAEKEIDHLELVPNTGKLTPEEYDQTVQDLVNYLVYMAEPAKMAREKIGKWVLFYLFIFAVIAYFLKKEFWRDVH